MQRDIIVADFNRLVTLLKTHGFDAVPESGGVGILTDGKNVGNTIRVWNECTNKVGTPPAKGGLFTGDPGLVWGEHTGPGYIFENQIRVSILSAQISFQFSEKCVGVIVNDIITALGVTKNTYVV
jgi:hypothetical protein